MAVAFRAPNLNYKREMEVLTDMKRCGTDLKLVTASAKVGEGLSLRVKSFLRREISHRKRLEDIVR